MATEKQKKTFNKSLENGGIVSRAAKGIYSPSMAKNPQKITSTKGWEELMEKNIPDKLLAEKHKELLTTPIKVKSKERKYGETTLIEEIEMLDTFAISKGLDMGYKLKGKYAPEKSQSVNLNLNTELKNSKESRELIDEYEAKIANMLKTEAKN